MPKLTVTNLLTGPFVIQDPTGIPGQDGLTPFSMSLDESGHAGGTDTKSASVTEEQVERLRIMLDAAQTASRITWKVEDDINDVADNYRRPLRVGTVTPIAVTIKDEVIISKLAAPGAVSVTLPASPPIGMEVEVVDGTGDAAANNITITPAAGTINGGASLVINVNRGVARLVRTATEWVAYVSSSISSGAAGGDLTGTYPNPTIGANKVTTAKLGVDVQGAFTTRAGAGVIDITNRTTKLTSAAVGASMTLADGTVAGQRKSLLLTALTTPGSHTAVVAPAHGGPWTLDTVGDEMELEFDGTNWIAINDNRAANRPPNPRILSGLGHNNAGACTLVGAKVGDKVVSVQNITDHLLASASFEAVITVADQIQQSSASDLSAKTVMVFLRPLS